MIRKQDREVNSSERMFL